jgi:Flavin containing amine oxidoreductase
MTMNRINRRGLLKYSLLVSAGLLGCDRLETIASSPHIQPQTDRQTSLTRKRPSKQESSGNVDTIIVGAGIAGLGAANVLRSQGKTVLILEARNRVGGRIFTDRSLGNIPLDLGASWIHGTQDNPLTELTRQIDDAI